MPSPTGASDSTSLLDDPLVGQPYRALRLLGAGGMGEVFLAEHRTLATPCVVKIQHTRLARDPNIADRIRLEAESLARLRHPNIVSILDSGRTGDDRPFIVMEHLRGQTMADELAARGRLPLLEALGYTCQLLRGLAAAHTAGIVHRDIKPDNLFLCDGQRGERVLKLLDFGVACTMPEVRLVPNPLAVPTATGSVVGALRYVSPEGALARRVDHRADLYSTALVLYFALAGRGPFDHIQSALLLLSAHVAEQPEPPSRFSNTPIPAELDQAVLRALRKAPGERFQSADELREELERVMALLTGSADASDIRALPAAAELSPDSSGSRIRTARLWSTADAALEQQGPLQVGACFLDKYEIRKQIGRGGQAWVYHGRHIFTARDVAIKIVHSPRGIRHETLERGKSEARALGKLDHPNIVVMHDAGVTEDGLFYIVMELLRGCSLRAALTAHGPFTVQEVLLLSTQAAEAVQAAHEIGVIHRDLTPDNIFLTRDNRVKVLDFGIAKVLNEIGFETNKDIVMGSVLYMSPEQVQGLPLTPRSDVCALGFSMFEMLLGKHPSLLLFERELLARNEPSRRPTLAEIPPIQLNRTPPSLSELDPNIPLALAQVVGRAIAKDPEARFASMRELVSKLRACQDEPITRRTANVRDLSRHVAEESEASPASQRATPRRGLLWDGAGTLTPLPHMIDPPDLSTAVSGVAAAFAPDGCPSKQTTGSRRSVAWLRIGFVVACLLGAALGSLGALRHFDAAKRVDAAGPIQALRAQAATARSANLVVASLTPALAVSAPEPPPLSAATPQRDGTADIVNTPRAGSLPPASHFPRSSSTAARATRAAAPAVAVTAAQSPQPITDVSRPLEIELGNKPLNPSLASEAPRKKLNGGKLIYGD